MGIVFVTLLLVVFRPKGIQIGYSALIGGAAALLLGLVSLQNLETIWGIVWNSTFTFVAIIIFSLVLEEAGFFRYLGYRIALLSRSSRKLLFIYISLATALVSAFFANDGAILVMTPVTFLLLKDIGFSPREMIPYLLSVSFIADIGSTPFVISNLVNIIAASYFGIDFNTYALVMVLPDIVTVMGSLGVMYLVFRGQISGKFTIPNGFDGQQVSDRLIFRLAVPLTVSLMAAYAITGIYGIPIAFVAVPSIAALFFLAYFRRNIDTRKILREAPWQVVLFSIGMFIVVFSIANSGLDTALAGSFQYVNSHAGSFSLTVSGLLIVPFTSLLNNLPATMLSSLAVNSMGAPHGMVYELILANDIGTKISPIGSLATLLWLHDLSARRKLTISAAEYIKYGAIISLPALILGSLALTFMLGLA
ncbi:MAG: SLC13 family permease [Candidatus Thermoplasmatota archaeon]|nr:SLC13 family permease [Candidatus Thermoplasmatota archaeon]MCL5799815.1 SLC13 family permease [Candidatus Thermoplasmatota archaeon]